ncbi:MAG: TonB-dependent receptor [Proteobacteria bacterium]|nr:TonB-dependent receptor [Pseudomonadota bacterium]MDA0992582.1 TonB-dependent receptor [Pseudomonadota bacterium]
MYAPSKFSITPVTAAVTAALYPGAAAMAQDPVAEERSLEEIVVTARKRTESLQDIPATVQAISQESLAAMGAKGMEDYARFVPSMNVVTYGPGSSTVVFRGAITGAGYLGQSTSSVYLDEISVTQTGGQPNIRPVDIARIEALSGPQGTLYGSDAQAGTMRILTNQPIMNTFEAIFDGEVRGGGQSDASYRGSLVFNVPLIEDKLALRVAGYNDHDGGYIDNVFGHTADSYGEGILDSDGIPKGNIAPAQWGTLDNSAVLEDKWNDADVYGGRVHLRWEMNDSWATTLSYHNQTTDSGAGNYYDPFVGDLEVVRFHNEWREEKFNMGSLKIEGDLGFAQLVGAVSYYEREITGLNDITTYAHYWSAQYCHDSDYTRANPPQQGDPGSYYTNAGAPYYWTNPDTGYIVWWPVYCHGPSVDADFFNSYRGSSKDDKMTAEIRLSSQGDTFDWIVGLYREESKDSWKSPFGSPTTGGNGTTVTYQNSMSLNFHEWYYSNYYGTPTTYPNAEEHWHSESHTDWEQSAIFGEVSWHINDEMALTVGGRYFERENTGYYFVNHPGGPNFTGEPDNTSGDRDYRLANNGRPQGRSGSEEQFIPKVSLDYALDDGKMIYGLYTRGVRQGGVNRSRGEPFFPNNYDSDIMDNYELGYKSTFDDGRGRFNVTVYKMDWSDYQLELVDPTDPPCEINGIPQPETDFSIPGVCGQPWQQLIANAGDAHINGVNVELEYAAGDNWLFGMNYEVMEAETDTSRDLDNDGDDDLVAGLRLPLVPSAKSSAWAEYRQPAKLFGSEEFFIRTQWSYTGDSLNTLQPRPSTHPNPRAQTPSYTIGDVRMGVVGDDWQVDVFVNNVTDERAIYTLQTGVFEWAAAQTQDGRAHHQTLYTARPREVGIRYMKRWGD